jgi:hypothetical protein
MFMSANFCQTQVLHFGIELAESYVFINVYAQNNLLPRLEAPFDEKAKLLIKKFQRIVLNSCYIEEISLLIPHR